MVELPSLLPPSLMSYTESTYLVLGAITGSRGYDGIERAPMPLSRLV